jgi:hypothetical protein
MLQWRRVILIVVVLSSALALLITRWIRVLSDDGPGGEDTAFQSPVLIWKYPLGDPSFLAQGPRTPGDLLTNGDMDQMGFYWRPPNHWLAGAWFEWFSTIPFNFPEFNDGFERHFSHTYPSSQRLQLWGNDYAGGLMQSVTVTPCVYYQFEAYGHSRPGTDNPPLVAVDSHMRVGIEPYGWMSGRSIHNYDPGLEPEAFPDTMVWSPEANHYFVYEPYRVTAEALSHTLTVALFSYPEVDLEGGVYWHDTLWDTASLLAVPPPSGGLWDGAPLPEPDGVVTNLHATLLPRVAIVEWETTVDASTQLLYRVAELTDPVSVTIPLSHSLYLPMVVSSVTEAALRPGSSLDFTPVRFHKVTITALPARYSLDFVALSRWLGGEACITSASTRIHTLSSDKGHAVALPLFVKGK